MCCVEPNHELFRFSGYEDVFIESPGRYLYVQSEPWDRAGLLACREYSVLPAGLGAGEWTGASPAYLRSLERADLRTAARVVKSEACATARYSLPPDEREAYTEAAFAEVDAAVLAAEGRAAA